MLLIAAVPTGSRIISFRFMSTVMLSMPIPSRAPGGIPAWPTPWIVVPTMVAICAAPEIPAATMAGADPGSPGGPIAAVAMLAAVETIA